MLDPVSHPAPTRLAPPDTLCGLLPAAGLVARPHEPAGDQVRPPRQASLLLPPGD
jgi:hypothetical protein